MVRRGSEHAARSLSSSSGSRKRSRPRDSFTFFDLAARIRPVKFALVDRPVDEGLERPQLPVESYRRLGYAPRLVLLDQKRGDLAQLSLSESFRERVQVLPIPPDCVWPCVRLRGFEKIRCRLVEGDVPWLPPDPSLSP